jgi:hypothetical protein
MWSGSTRSTARSGQKTCTPWWQAPPGPRARRGFGFSPELVAAINHAERVILEAGVPLGGAAFTKEQTRALVEKGYRLIGHQFDVLILKKFVQQTADWRSI